MWIKINSEKVLIDGVDCVRRDICLSHVELTPLLIEKLPRGAGTKAVIKKWKLADIDNKWAGSSWCKRLEVRNRRRNLTDFEKFELMILKKRKRYNVRRLAAKIV